MDTPPLTWPTSSCDLTAQTGVGYCQRTSDSAFFAGHVWYLNKIEVDLIHFKLYTYFLGFYDKDSTHHKLSVSIFECHQCAVANINPRVIASLTCFLGYLS